MLKRALRDDCWDVLMVGFNLLNPSARERVLQPAIERGVGTLIMFAVRRALSQPAELRKVVLDLVERGAIPSDGIDLDDPLGFLIAQDRAPWPARPAADPAGRVAERFEPDLPASSLKRSMLPRAIPMGTAATGTHARGSRKW